MPIKENPRATIAEELGHGDVRESNDVIEHSHQRRHFGQRICVPMQQTPRKE
jgi:hypothetical protein